MQFSQQTFKQNKNGNLHHKPHKLSPYCRLLFRLLGMRWSLRHHHSDHQIKEMFQTSQTEAKNPRLCIRALRNLPLSVIAVNTTSLTYHSQTSGKAQLAVKMSQFIRNRALKGKTEDSICLKGEILWRPTNSHKNYVLRSVETSGHFSAIAALAKKKIKTKKKRKTGVQRSNPVMIKLPNVRGTELERVKP